MIAIGSSSSATSSRICAKRSRLTQRFGPTCARRRRASCDDKPSSPAGTPPALSMGVPPWLDIVAWSVARVEPRPCRRRRARTSAVKKFLVSPEGVFTNREANRFLDWLASNDPTTGERYVSRQYASRHPCATVQHVRPDPQGVARLHERYAHGRRPHGHGRRQRRRRDARSSTQSARRAHDAPREREPVRAYGHGSTPPRVRVPDRP